MGSLGIVRFQWGPSQNSERVIVRAREQSFGCGLGALGSGFEFRFEAEGVGLMMVVITTMIKWLQLLHYHYESYV